MTISAIGEPCCEKPTFQKGKTKIMESSPPPTVKDVKILETVEDIQERREQVLKKYVEFKEAARSKREMLEDSRRFQYFRRDADELEHWIEEKLQVASDESFKVKTTLVIC